MQTFSRLLHFTKSGRAVDNSFSVKAGHSANDPIADIRQSDDNVIMHIGTKSLRALEFSYCATVGLWLVVQSKFGFPARLLSPIVEAVCSLVIIATLLLIVKNALSRDAKRAVVLLAATITAFGVFAKSYEPLVHAGMDYKLPYVLFSYIQLPLAIFGWLTAWASWREKQYIRNVN